MIKEDITIVKEIKDLGFKQYGFNRRKQAPTNSENIQWIDYFEYGCEFDNGVYHIIILSNSYNKFVIIKKVNGDWVGYPSVEDGRPYTLETGLIRLKELINGRK